MKNYSQCSSAYSLYKRWKKSPSSTLFVFCISALFSRLFSAITKQTNEPRSIMSTTEKRVSNPYLEQSFNSTLPGVYNQGLIPWYFSWFKPVFQNVGECLFYYLFNYSKIFFSLYKIGANVHKDDTMCWSFLSHFPPAGTSLAGVAGGLAAPASGFFACFPAPLIRSPISVPIIVTIKYKNHLLAMYLPREARRTDRTNPNNIFWLRQLSAPCQCQVQ